MKSLLYIYIYFFFFNLPYSVTLLPQDYSSFKALEPFRGRNHRLVFSIYRNKHLACECYTQTSPTVRQNPKG